MMVLINVAEWCVEALVLSLAFFFAALGTFIFLMLITIIKTAFNRSKTFNYFKEWVQNFNKS